MKLYLLIGIVVIVLALLIIISPTNDLVKNSPTLNSSSSNVVNGHYSNQANNNDKSGLTTYTVFVVDNEFSPSVMYVNKGDTVRLTFATGNEKSKDDSVEVPYDFTLDEFGISTYVNAAQEVEFVADKTGEFTYNCLTCSPQIFGTLVVN